MYRITAKELKEVLKDVPDDYGGHLCESCRTPTMAHCLPTTMYSVFYPHLLGPHEKVTCSRCHREFDEETTDMEPDAYGGPLCYSCRTPTMAIDVPRWVEDAIKEVKWPH